MTEIGRISPELAEAQNQVEMYRTRLDQKLHEVQSRIDAGREGLNRIVTQARRVDRLSHEFPLSNVGVFLLAGFLLGGMIARGREVSYRSTLSEPSLVHGTEGAKLPEGASAPSENPNVNFG